MIMGRRFQLFKIASITLVVIVFLTLATKPRFTENLDGNVNQRADSIKQEEAKIESADNNEEIVNENSENTINDNQASENVEVQTSENVEVDDQITFDDTIPGAYLRFNEPAEVNKSYCKFNYGFPYDLEYKGKINRSSPGEGKESPYRTIYNIIEAHDIQNVLQVTYASHMTANFAYFIPELLRYWDGLVTIAAFVPDLDAAFFLEQINQYCYCEPEMYRVSIHIVTHKTVPFSKKDIYFDRPDNCIPRDSSKIAIYTDFEDTMVYPVNVLRNIARTSVRTKYVISSDIELIPSKGLASGFLKMIENYKEVNLKEVFVVPIFEVNETESIPENKEELIKLIEVRKAVYFHEIVCEHCQKFPGIEKWLSNGFAEEITPLVTVKRQKPYHRWEPLFIGTNKEPLYSEKLSWEGLQDKMTQSLEMCLMDYNYTILDNAFLCHWPGIKTHKVVEEEWRINFVLENKVAYKEIIQGLKEQYDDIPGCMVNYTSAKLPTKKNYTNVF